MLKGTAPVKHASMGTIPAPKGGVERKVDHCSMGKAVTGSGKNEPCCASNDGARGFEGGQGAENTQKPVKTYAQGPKKG